MDEKPLLNVVVVPPLQSRQLSVNPPKVFRLFGHAGVFGPNPQNPPLCLDVPSEHFVGGKRHNVCVPACFFSMQQTDHFAASGAQDLGQGFRRFGFGNHVNLTTAVLVSEKLQGRLLGVDSVCNFQDQNVAMRLPKPVEQSRLEVHHVHQGLVLGKHGVRLAHDGLESVPCGAFPNLCRRHHHQLAGSAHFPWQRHPSAISFARTQ